MILYWRGVRHDWRPACDCTSHLFTCRFGRWREIFTVFPLLPNSPPLPPNIERAFTSYYNSFTEEENKELEIGRMDIYPPTLE
jgi:hypothetical protein